MTKKGNKVKEKIIFEKKLSEGELFMIGKEAHHWLMIARNRKHATIKIREMRYYPREYTGVDYKRYVITLSEQVKA